MMMKVFGFPIILAILTLFLSFTSKAERPRVFVFTDINIDAGDPDDRQSLIHLLWYANALEIEGIVPDRWHAQGLEACKLAVEHYTIDFSKYHFSNKDYPPPDKVKSLLATDLEDAIQRFQKAASENDSPLYVLIWGNMHNFGKALTSKPQLSKNIRLITIGTNLMMEAYRPELPESWEKTQNPCEQFIAHC